MHILYVSSEVLPYSGGLGDFCEVAGNLPRALARKGIDVTVVTPFYEQIDPARHGLARRLRKLELEIAGQIKEVGLYEGKLGSFGAKIWFVDHPPSFARECDGPADAARRYFVLARAAIEIAADVSPDVIHAGDWTTGFVPLLARCQEGVERSKIVFTITDPEATGSVPPSILDELAIGRELFHPEGIEFYGQVSLLKAGVVCSDQLTTLSPSFAELIQQEPDGGGLHGLYANLSQKLAGILGGVDEERWNPAINHRLPARFSGDDLAGKQTCKLALQEELGLPFRPRTPLLSLLGPLDARRGAEIVLDAAPELTRRKLQLAFFGDGEPQARARVAQLAAEHPGRVAYRPALSFDEHRVLAGSDALLLPHRWNPSGLLQLKAMRYGAVPISRPVGGLADTIVDFDPPSATGTGFVFGESTAEALLATTRRLLAVYDGDRWPALARNAMSQRYSWELAAERYEQLYSKLLAPAADG